MQNSKLLTAKDQNLSHTEKQHRYVLRCLVQKNACPNCGYQLNFFEGAGVDIDNWEDKPGPTDCKCTVCKRELVYVVPVVAGGGNGGWRWHLVPMDPKR
jgi:hypothetical protein